MRVHTNHLLHPFACIYCWVQSACPLWYIRCVSLEKVGNAQGWGEAAHTNPVNCLQTSLRQQVSHLVACMLASTASSSYNNLPGHLLSNRLADTCIKLLHDPHQCQYIAKMWPSSSVIITGTTTCICKVTVCKMHWWCNLWLACQLEGLVWMNARLISPSWEAHTLCN